jgi:phage FluMu protein gp41
VDRVGAASGIDVFLGNNQGREAKGEVVELPPQRRLLYAEGSPTIPVVVGVAALQRAVEKQGDYRGRLPPRALNQLSPYLDLEDAVGYLAQIRAHHVRALHQRVEDHPGTRHEGSGATGA